VNESLIKAAEQLLPVVGTREDAQIQTQLASDYDFVLGKGTQRVKGPSAGLVWMNYAHLSPDSPPQVVGHTRHTRPQTKGNVHCQDVLQDNLESTGGEAVFIETPDSLTALVREGQKNTETISLNQWHPPRRFILVASLAPIRLSNFFRPAHRERANAAFDTFGDDRVR